VGFLNAGGQTVSSVVFPAAGQTVGFQVTTPSLGFNETQTVTVVAEMAVSGFTASAQLTIRGPAKPPKEKEKEKNEKLEIKERGEKVQLEKALPQENIAVQPSPRLGGGISFGALPEATDEELRAGSGAPAAPEAPQAEAEGRAFIPPEGRDSGETASIAALSEPLPEPRPEPAPEPPPTAPASRPRSRRRTPAAAAAPAPVPEAPAPRSRSRRRSSTATAEAPPQPEAPAPRPRSRRRTPATAEPEATPPEAQPEAPPAAEGGRARRRRRST
jgi:hypothetical protein